MSVSTLAMMSLEQAFLAASCSVTVSRKMTHSIRPPLHMTLEVQVSHEVRTSSHTSSEKPESGCRDQHTFPSLWNPEKKQTLKQILEKIIATAVVPLLREQIPGSRSPVALSLVVQKGPLLSTSFQILPSSSSSLALIFHPSQSPNPPPPVFSCILNSLVTIHNSPHIFVSLHFFAAFSLFLKEVFIAQPQMLNCLFVVQNC